MDRNTWMYMVERFTANYMKGLSKFMKCAEDHRERMRETKFSCPCKECRNIVSLADPNMIRQHLIEHGFDKNYTCWDLHGETREPQVDSQTFVSDTNHEENDSNDDNHRDNLDEMIYDVESNVDEKNVKKLQQLFVDAEKPLYNECPKQPGNDINVYLRPIIYNMIDLWETGVDIYDAYKKERFKLFAMIYCTINDISAYRNLSGGRLTDITRTVKRKKLFDGTIEDRSMAEPMDEYAAFSQVADLNITFGKKVKLLLNISGKKVSSGYSANIKNLVSMKVLKLLGYVAKEVVQFCTNYMDDVADIGLPQPRHQGRIDGVGTIGRKDVTLTNDDFEQAHFTILQNMTCIEPYIHEHMSYLVENNSRRDQRWLEAEHKRTFSQWLADKFICMSLKNVDADMIQLGYRPLRVLQYQGYDINGYTFYTKQQDDKSTVQNNGVTLIATTTDSSRMTIVKNSYYGVVEDIWELDYTSFVIPLLKCKWVNNTRGTRTRRLISILKKNWKQVTKEEKNFLWSDIKAHFRFENDDVKKRTLISCGTKWKTFKTKLRVKFMLKKVSSLRKWTLIEPNAWEEFYIHGSNYCLARAPRDKNGINTLPPELIDVSKNLVQATRELAQGSNESKARVDPLILVLRPKHGGRTRGARCDIGYKKGIKGYVRKKRTYEQQQNIEEIRNKVRQQMKEELKSSDFWEEIRAELKVELRNEMQAEQNLFSPREDDVPNSVHMKSSLNLTTIMVRNETQAQQNVSFSPRQKGNHSSVQMRSNLSSTKSIKGRNNKEETYCCLCIPSSVLAEEKVVCATATVYPIGDGILHFKKLLKGHMKVSVIKVVEIHKRMCKTPVSGVPTKRVMPQHENAPYTKKEKENETPKEPNKQDKALEETTKHQKTTQKIDEVKEQKAANRKSLQDLEDEVLLNRPQSVIDGYYKWMSRGDYAESYAISVNKKVFHQYDESYFTINATDIIELLTYQELECGIMTLFEMSLYHLKGHSSQNKVGFLNHGMITTDSCFYEKWATKDYLTQSLTSYEFYLAPYLQGRHYVLFTICPKHRMGFILNSSKGSITNEQCYRLVGLVDSVVGSLKWEFPLVNCQQGD
uniref:Ulp1 protease family, C-terminal catalytic domain-containing protein n=1 Tax=Tanacetum cinerariifolium TaxID=118510 RepID=A0A699GKW6_TANCI|nr:ulp1 protease family, C-terminal catalytic domain-containing protein [Tanacetum cinerariifolium]